MAFPTSPYAATAPPPRIRSPFSYQSFKDCGHHYCHLGVQTCCACSDKRPVDAYNPVYVDGRGLLGVKGRPVWGYCPACKAKGGKTADQSFFGIFHDLPLPPRPKPKPAPTPRPHWVPYDPHPFCRHSCLYLRRRLQNSQCCFCSFQYMLEEWESTPVRARKGLASRMPQFCRLCRRREGYALGKMQWREAKELERANRPVVLRGRRGRERERKKRESEREAWYAMGGLYSPSLTEGGEEGEKEKRRLVVTGVVKGDEHSLAPLGNLRAAKDYSGFSVWTPDDDLSDDEDEDERVISSEPPEEWLAPFAEVVLPLQEDPPPTAPTLLALPDPADLTRPSTPASSDFVLCTDDEIVSWDGTFDDELDEDDVASLCSFMTESSTCMADTFSPFA